MNKKIAIISAVTLGVACLTVGAVFGASNMSIGVVRAIDIVEHTINLDWEDVTPGELDYYQYFELSQESALVRGGDFHTYTGYNYFFGDTSMTIGQDNHILVADGGKYSGNKGTNLAMSFDFTGVDEFTSLTLNGKFYKDEGKISCDKVITYAPSDLSYGYLDISLDHVYYKIELDTIVINYSCLVE